jgi:hypothetical protein
MVEWYDKRRFDVEQSPARGLSYQKQADKGKKSLGLRSLPL